MRAPCGLTKGYERRVNAPLGLDGALSSGAPELKERTRSLRHASRLVALRGVSELPREPAVRSNLRTT
jgi:hypothetical protein